MRRVTVEWRLMEMLRLAKIPSAYSKQISSHRMKMRWYPSLLKRIGEEDVGTNGESQSESQFESQFEGVSAESSGESESESQFEGVSVESSELRSDYSGVLSPNPKEQANLGVILGMVLSKWI